MKSNLFLFTLVVLLPTFAWSQVGVNTTTPKAALDVESTDNGILIPRVQLTSSLDVTTVVNPNAGPLETSTLVYNMAPDGVTPNNVVAGFYYWDGSKWVPIAGDTSDHDWYEEGTTAAPNVISDNMFHIGKVAIGTATPAANAAFQVDLGTNATDGILFTGTHNAAATVPNLGAGSKMMFFPGKSAFRAGNVFSNEWDNSNIGEYSIAMGRNVIASGENSIAFGYGATAIGFGSIALGTSNAVGGVSMSMGSATYANGFGSFAMGVNSTANGNGSIAGGNLSVSTGNYSFAMGDHSQSIGLNSVAMGEYSRANQQGSIALGIGAIANGIASVALGQSTSNGINATALSSSTSTGDYSISGGLSAVSTGNNSVAFGLNSQSIGTNSIAFGENTTAAAQNAVAIGSNANANAPFSTALGISTAGGNVSTAMGATTANGFSSTSLGHSSFANGNFSIAAGYNLTAQSYGEISLGVNNRPYTVSALGATTFDANDHLFNLGNGNGAPHNALTIFKDGRLNINEEYTLPNTDGNANQIMQTDGAGNVTWQDSNSTAWSLTGNAGTNPATLFGNNFAATENFIGTTDYEDLLFGTNNRPIIKMTAFGNVGIGIDNPNAKLHINDNSSYITSWITKTNVDNGFGGYVSPTFIVNTTSTLSEANETNYNAQFFSGGTNIGTNVAGFFSANQATNNYAIIVPENGGNVGIGTSTPTEKLHVFSNLDIDKSSIFGTSTQVSTSADFLNVGVKGNGNGSGSFGFGIGVLGTTDVNSTWNSTGVYAQLGAVNPSFSSFTSSNQALVANGNGLGRAAMFLGGNVGIGLPLTSNPTTLLHINSATNGAVRIVDGTEGNSKILTSNATGVATWQNPTPSGFTHYLGELYLGGIIFELYKGSDGLEHGLVVSLTESGLIAWQTPLSLTGANRSEDGAYNTALMTSSPVATYIASLGAGWYLPSIDELSILFNNRYYANKALRLGGYTLLSISNLYWSSTELDIAAARALNFGLGTFYYETKSDTNYARGIRQF